MSSPPSRRRIALCIALSFISLWGPGLVMVLSEWGSGNFLEMLLAFLGLPFVAPMIGIYMFDLAPDFIVDAISSWDMIKVVAPVFSLLFLAASTYLMMRGKRWIFGVFAFNIVVQVFGFAGVAASAAV